MHPVRVLADMAPVVRGVGVLAAGATAVESKAVWVVTGVWAAG